MNGKTTDRISVPGKVLAPMKITKAQNKWITKQAKDSGESRATVVRQLIDKAIEADK